MSDLPSSTCLYLSQRIFLRQNGGFGQKGFLLTARAFNFSINALEPNTYDGLLFVTDYGHLETS